MEEGAKDAGFDSLAIFQPAAITGNSNTPSFLNWISPGMDKIMPRKYASIHKDDLGKAQVYEMLRQMGEHAERQPVVTYEGGATIKALLKIDDE